MSQAEVIIDRSQALPVEQDYHALREEALGALRVLCGQTWSDHNLHDPGITSLEVQCHALADIGYRTAFEMRDLLTRDDGSADPGGVSGLFPAHEILTTGPLTVEDYRRLLLKVGGIRNAWLRTIVGEAPGEPRIYHECERGLVFEPSAESAPLPLTVTPNGLYRVMLELEIDPEVGPLGAPWVSHRIIEDVTALGVVIAVSSDDRRLDSLETNFDRQLETVETAGVSEQVTSSSEALQAENPRVGQWKTGVVLRFDQGASIALDVYSRAARPRRDFDPDASRLSLTPDILKVVLESSTGPVFKLWKRHERAQAAVKAVRCVLLANRNLCEDFVKIETVPIHPLGVCADIEVSDDADLERVQAEVVFAIEQYLNPPAHRYGLQELIHPTDGGEATPVDEIFEAPYVDFELECEGHPVFTQPGFVKTKDLRNSELRRQVFTSDLIDRIMEIPDIIAVRNVMLRSYDAFGVASGQADPWRLAIEDAHQPMLSLEHSKLLFLKREIPMHAGYEEFERTLDHLRGLSRKEAYVPEDEALETRAGSYRSPGAFYSIQNDYPLVYGVGEAGLPAHASPQRRVQARRFKAYLTVFDQLMADQLAQLEHLPELFSLRKLDRTRFTRELKGDIPAVEDDFGDEIYIDPSSVKEDLNALVENSEMFLERRHRLLDHLMARFSETLPEPPKTSLRSASFEFGSPTEEERLDRKREFLKGYPALSRTRSLGYDYSHGGWGSDNVSGFERRIALQLGIESPGLNPIACDIVEKLFSVVPVGGEFRLEIKSEGSGTLYRSEKRFATTGAAMTAARSAYKRLHIEEGYERSETNNGRFRFGFRRTGGALLHDASFASEREVIQAIIAIVERHDRLLLGEDGCEGAGLHVMEHLLLRPRIATRNDDGAVVDPKDALLQLCGEASCDACGDEDPYSFRISVVLAGWTPRARVPSYRAFVERTIGEEAPAHVQVRVCWIGNAQMHELDLALRAWVEAQSGDASQTSPAVVSARSRLVELLQRLRTIHPAAVLHDCDDDDDGSPVRLDYTSLGTL